MNLSIIFFFRHLKLAVYEMTSKTSGKKRTKQILVDYQMMVGEHEDPRCSLTNCNFLCLMSADRNENPFKFFLFYLRSTSPVHWLHHPSSQPVWVDPNRKQLQNAQLLTTPRRERAQTFTIINWIVQNQKAKTTTTTIAKKGKETKISRKKRRRKERAAATHKQCHIHTLARSLTLSTEQKRHKF